MFGNMTMDSQVALLEAESRATRSLSQVTAQAATDDTSTQHRGRCDCQKRSKVQVAADMVVTTRASFVRSALATMQVWQAPCNPSRPCECPSPVQAQSKSIHGRAWGVTSLICRPPLFGLADNSLTFPLISLINIVHSTKTE